MALRFSYSDTMMERPTLPKKKSSSPESLHAGHFGKWLKILGEILTNMVGSREIQLQIIRSAAQSAVNKTNSHKICEFEEMFTRVIISLSLL
ncbi:hypothetical protein TNCV_2992141 [Trichonephila clavipes]|nr:hypothetical protein TNCV_2992141 [Trichonephila clavipes]